MIKHDENFMSKPNKLFIKGFNPVGDLIGLNFTKFELGYSRCEIEVDEKLMNPHKVLHDGVIYTMVDTGMVGAFYSYLKKDELCATLEVKIFYFAAVTTGEIICDTVVVHKDEKFAILESNITNEGRLVAKTVGIFSIFKVKKH